MINWRRPEDELPKRYTNVWIYTGNKELIRGTHTVDIVKDHDGIYWGMDETVYWTYESEILNTLPKE